MPEQTRKMHLFEVFAPLDLAHIETESRPVIRRKPIKQTLRVACLKPTSQFEIGSVTAHHQQNLVGEEDTPSQATRKSKESQTLRHVLAEAENRNPPRESSQGLLQRRKAPPAKRPARLERMTPVEGPDVTDEIALHQGIFRPGRDGENAQSWSLLRGMARGREDRIHD